MININLLPPELKLKRIEAKRNATLANICLLVVLVFLVIAIIFRSGSSTLSAYLENAKKTVNDSSSITEEDKNIQEQALFVNDRWKANEEIYKKRVFWSEVLKDLTSLVPTNIQFENLNMKEDKTPNFILQGNAPSEKEIINLKDKLEESLFFKNVNFKSSSIVEDKDKPNKTSFTLEFDIEQRKASK